MHLYSDIFDYCQNENFGATFIFTLFFGPGCERENKTKQMHSFYVLVNISKLEIRKFENKQNGQKSMEC